jgi:hypothetical protein
MRARARTHFSHVSRGAELRMHAHLFDALELFFLSFELFFFFLSSPDLERLLVGLAGGSEVASALRAAARSGSTSFARRFHGSFSSAGSRKPSVLGAHFAS